MDAFYASVEQHDEPALRGKPVLVGGMGKRGVVCAASYESRVFGCRSAMPMSVAMRLCPKAIVVRPRFARYIEISERVRSIMESFTPTIEPLSLDEAFLDVTGSVALLGEPAAMAEALRGRVKEAVGVTCSVGAAPNKFLAKLASDMNKPDGVTVLGPTQENIQAQIDPLAIERMWGVGPKTAPKLHTRGWRTFRDVRLAGLDELRAALGDFGEHCWQLSQGIDARAVQPERESKSIGHEETFHDDLEDHEELRAILLAHIEHVARRLRRNGLVCRTVSLKLRRPDFTTFSRSITLENATDDTGTLWREALGVFDVWSRSPAAGALRLLGIHLSGLAPAGSDGAGGQLPLFGPTPDGAAMKRSRVDRTTDAIATRFGSAAIGRARAIHKKP
jgi:DNA polymerase IV